MEIGLVKNVDIDQEMQQAYLDYAMSVIVARALPDARDGLKPVQRRILFGMYDMGLRADTGYKKSARIVGEVLGKYHPHGDQSVYEAMARMAQDFSMRYALVDGQGNFGSVDGDPPAAMRYTEARLTPVAVDILSQLDRDTIDFTRNFDDSLNEPDVLPAAIPNLLVNGASGIAVGMATSIPPHNLAEVVEALNYLLERWETQEDVTVSDLMKFVKGPDFPTGGIILHENNGEDLLSAYATGRGKVTLRGKVHLEEMGRGKNRIIITELPYQINKSSLIERIAELAREGGLDGISDLRDESDRQGMRIVIELNKVAETENVLRGLYKRTPLQTTFRISLLALVAGEPHMLSLKQALRVYLEHRITVVRRRSEHDLAKAKARAHILDGLRIALDNLDEVINLIRKAQDVDDARTKLMKRYKLSELQANAILEMQLRRLAALERRKIELEYKEVQELIAELEGLLKSPRKLRQVVSDELKAMKTAYADRRRTQIVALTEGMEMKNLLTTTDMMPSLGVWVGVTANGIIGRTTGDVLPRWSGRNAPKWLYATTTHHTLYLAASDGRAAAIAVQSLPEVEKFSDGAPLHKALPFEDNPKLVQLFAAPTRLEENAEQFVVTVSRAGLVKKSSLRDLPGPSTQLFTLAKVNPGDEIGWAVLTDGKSEIMLATQRGMVIRFTEEDVRPMGLVAAGVNGIKLAAKDQVMGAARIVPEFDLLLVGRDGKAWRLPTAQLPVQGRYGQGAIACKPPPGGELVGMVYSHPGQEIIIEMKDGASRVETIGSIPAGRRQSTAKTLTAVKPGDQVTGLTVIEDGLAYWEKRQGVVQKKTRRVVAPEPHADQLALPLDGQPKRTRFAEKPPAAKAAPAKKTEKAGTPKSKAATAKSEDKPKTTRSASSPTIKKIAAKEPTVKTGVVAPPKSAAKPTATQTGETTAKTATTTVKVPKAVGKPAKIPAKPAAKTSAVVKKTTAVGKASASKPPTKSAATPTTKSKTKPLAKPSAKKPAETTRKPTVRKPTTGSTKPAAKKPAGGTARSTVKPAKTPLKKPGSETK
ncbi:MAG TPA: DNA topoisomerase (ATP-hydrolyzing) [Bellilinea sp.]|nr:DNA topoisomerase (ATP-hydrolyzing) [Bellilinea sp.]